MRAFGPLQEEADEFRDFNALMDSGIISRVRELKASLGPSFYHPGVLATVAPYNARFGARFDTLFREAAEEIKQFAKSLEELGGNILSTVDGIEVTVEHVAALEANELLKSDYSTALEKFRRVSKLKKELERRPPIRRAKLTSSSRSAARPIPMRSGSGAAAAAAPARQYKPAAVTAQQLALEEARLTRVIESIRIFLRVADPKFRKVVPMRYFNLTLSTSEVDAFCADYLEEKSARSEVGRTLVRIVAVVARMGTEMEEMRRSHASPSLWKLRADALVTLLEVGRALNEQTTKKRRLRSPRSRRTSRSAEGLYAKTPRPRRPGSQNASPPRQQGLARSEIQTSRALAFHYYFVKASSRTGAYSPAPGGIWRGTPPH